MKINLKTKICPFLMSIFLEEGMWHLWCDPSKAFDYVHHSILLSKLNYHESKITGYDLTYLIEDKDKVVFKDSSMSYCSSRKINTIGVPQVSIFDPLLFMIYINNFPYNVEKTKAVLLADDTTLFWTKYSRFGEINYNNEGKLVFSKWSEIKYKKNLIK